MWVYEKCKCVVCEGSVMRDSLLAEEPTRSSMSVEHVSSKGIHSFLEPAHTHKSPASTTFTV